MSWARGHSLLLRLLLPAAALSLAAALPAGGQVTGGEAGAAQGKVPFTIERAESFFQRTDSSGAERFILQGDVLVNRAGSRIRCEILTYFPQSRHFLCLDSVRLTDPQREMKSDTLFYYVDTGYYRALGNLRWASSGFTGSGLQGDYYRLQELLVVRGKAVAGDSLRRVEADKLEYDYRSSTLRATGNITLTDNETRASATAAAGLYERDTGITSLTGRPLLNFYDKSDSLALRPYHLSCDRLLSFGADSMVALGRVRLWDDSLTITSDSLFYDADHGRSYFRKGAPRIDSPSYNMSGETIDVHTRDRELERVVAVGAGRGEFYRSAAARADSAARDRNWIEGDTLDVSFGPGGLDSIVASGDARSYFREGPESALNYVIGARIVLVWQQGLVDRVEVSGGGRGLHLLPDTLVQMSDNPDSARIDTMAEKQK
ncbi:MAG: hypothetical protein JXQ83_02745 [Candidatus Glassbacteria bacterium]|nr:hypothetical protein [Candidatus Glassbacteria bacterium]